MISIELELLDLLLDSRSSFLTSQQLAEFTDSSDRTVRKYINLLNDNLKNHGAIVISKKGYGYRLDILDNVLFDDYYSEKKYSSNKFSDVKMLVLNEDRERYIINQLFLEDRQLSLTKLADNLYLSKTTVSHLLTDIRKLLSPYNITIQNKKRYLEVVGDESDIRRFIKNYFFADAFQGSIFSLFEEEILDKTSLSEIISIVIDECRNFQLSIPDYIIHNLVLHLALMIKQIKSGNQIILPEGYDFLSNTFENSIAAAIKARLETYFQLDLPFQEIDFITVHLRGKSNKDSNLLRGNVISALSQLGIELGIHLEDDEALVTNLCTHLQALLARLEKEVKLENPLKESILEKYYLTIIQIRRVFEKLPELSTYHISDDELVYISLHILASMEKLESRLQYRTLVVCATGMGSARFLKNRLERCFSNSLRVDKVISYFELSELDLSQFDVIITSVDLSNMFFLVPVISVSVLLEEGDIKRIEEFLSVKANSNKLSDNVVPHLSLFNKEQFLYIEDRLSKEEVLECLLNNIQPSPTEEVRKLFNQQLELRESFGSIVFNDCLAFPHPAKPITIKEQVIVAVLKHPVIWDNTHQDVRIVFLISPSTVRNENIKNLAPVLSAFAEDRQRQEKLLSFPNFEQFITLLQ